MSEEQHEYDESRGSRQGEGDVLSLLKKMQQQLTFLEKKVDILLGQSEGRSHGTDYPRRPRSFDRPYRKEGEERRERKPSYQGRGFEKRHDEQREEYPRKREQGEQRGGSGYSGKAFKPFAGGKKPFGKKKYPK